MPTSIAHAVAGGAVARVAGGRAVTGTAATVFVIVLANLPDVDFLLGALVGQPRDWHRGATHTLTAALGVALVVAGLATRFGHRFTPIFLLAFALYGSHLALDVVMPDRRGETGIPLFWPFHDAVVYAPIPLPPQLWNLLNLPIGDTTDSFFRSLATWRALTVFVFEGLLFSPLLLAAVLLRPARAGIRGSSAPQGKMPRSM